MSVRRQPVRSAFVDWFLPLWAFSPFEDLQAPMVLTGTLRKWNPCGTASSSVHPILSVCVCVTPCLQGLLPTNCTAKQGH